MRCNGCGYELWNLRERSCPECGTAFRPSQFLFRPRAVRYCCPHCDQAYHGTDANGHLEPRSFICVKCGQPIEMDRMVLHAEPGLETQGTLQGSMPWLDRSGGSLVAAWLKTIGVAMMKPTELIRGIPERAEFGPALRFMAVTVSLFLFVGVLAPNALVFLLGAVGGGAGQLALILLVGLGQGIAIATVLVVSAVVWLLIAHAFARMLGGQATLMRSAHCICYGSAASLMLAIPCGCVSFSGCVWWVVSATLMMADAHRLSGGRSSAAVVPASVIAALVVFVPLVVGAMMLFFVALAGIGGGGFGPGGPFPGMGGAGAAGWGTRRAADAQAVYLRDALVARLERDGAMPRHVVELLGDTVGHDDFSIDDGPPEAATVGDTPLVQIAMDSTGAARAAAIERALPEGAVAYRVGRLIFAHAGVRIDDSPELWLVIAMPRTGTAGSRASAMSIHVATLGGEVDEFVLDELAERVEAQNVIRRELGLPELPPSLSPMPWIPPAGGS